MSCGIENMTQREHKNCPTSIVSEPMSNVDIAKKKNNCITCDTSTIQQNENNESQSDNDAMRSKILFRQNNHH